MPRRNVLSSRDTNSRPWPPPGVILSEGTCGLASIDPNYKPSAANVQIEEETVDNRFYSGQELCAMRDAARSKAKASTTTGSRNQAASKQTEKAKPIGSDTMFSEGSWGVLTDHPKELLAAAMAKLDALKNKKKAKRRPKGFAFSNPSASGPTFSEGNWGLMVEEPTYVPTFTEANLSNANKKGTKRKKGSESDSTNDNDNDNDNNENATTSKRTKKATTSDYPKDANNLIDVSTIYLEDEEDSDVPIYATATDIRRELTTLLQTPGISAAGLCRTLSAASGLTISTTRLTTFRNKGKKGGASVDGADSPVFYAAWVYLEKVRLLTGGRKSKHRLEMEEAWGEDGMSRRGLQTVVVTADTMSLEYDRLGRMVRNGVAADMSGGWKALAGLYGF